MLPLQMQAPQAGTYTDDTETRYRSKADGHVGATAAPQSLLINNSRPINAENIAFGNARTFAIDVQPTIGPSTIAKSESKSTENKKDLVEKETELPSKFEDPESMWEKYQVAFHPSDIERLLMEEKIKVGINHTTKQDLANISGVVD